MAKKTQPQLTDSMKSALVLAAVGGGFIPPLTHQRTVTALQARELITEGCRLTREGFRRAAALDSRVRIPREDCPNIQWHGSAPARADQKCAECPATELEPVLPSSVAELKADPPTSSSSLALIGRCWAGGTHTGSALKAWHAGDFTLAAAFALDQLFLQSDETDPLEAQPVVDTQAVVRDAYWTTGPGADVLERDQVEELKAGRPVVVTDQAQADAVVDHLLAASAGVTSPAAAEERGRMAEAKLAQAILADYQAAVRVIDAPKVYPVTRQENGTLMVENAGGDPAGQEVTGRRARVVRGDVVRIHRGTALYEVLRVETDRALDRTKPGAEPEDFSMAQLAPLDPDREDTQLRWESLDLLHRVPPAARVTTLPVGPKLELAEDFVAVAGGGWDMDLGYLRQPALVYGDGARVPSGSLAPVPLEVLEDGTVVPVGVLRVGDAIVISGRCFTVTWDGAGDPTLVPQRWRDR